MNFQTALLAEPKPSTTHEGAPSVISIDRDFHDGLLAGTRVLESSPMYGPSVYLTDDGRIVKIFHRRRRFTTTRFSYARRFARHARQLASLGFQSVTIEAVYTCAERGTELVVYPMLPGVSVRKLAGTAGGRRALAALPRYLAKLHARGVHFRGIHLGNILYDECGRFALIDVSFMRFVPWRLDLRSRASNFRHILRYEQDTGLLLDAGLADFMQRYFDAATLSPRQCRRLVALIDSRELPPPIRATLERLPIAQVA